VIISTKTKIRLKIFWDVDLGNRYNQFIKKRQSSNISCYCPFNANPYIMYMLLGSYITHMYSLLPKGRAVDRYQFNVTLLKWIGTCFSKISMFHWPTEGKDIPRHQHGEILKWIIFYTLKVLSRKNSAACCYTLFKSSLFKYWMPTNEKLNY